MEAVQFRQLPGSPLRPARAWRVAAGDGIGLRIAVWWPKGQPAPGDGSHDAPPTGAGVGPVALAAAAYPGPYAGWETAADLGPQAPSGAPRGTVLLLPGRTEYVEKYSPVATTLTAHGYHVIAVDFRGQGASDRLLDDRSIGHVEDFADYQQDIAAMVAAANALALPRPWHMLAHSMGAAIGLRALIDGLPVASAVLSAPMWGIRFGGLPAPVGNSVARGVTRAAGRAGRGVRGVPGSGSVLATGFHRNMLTSDLEQYIRLMRHAALWPDFSVGAPTFDWVAAALRECRTLARLPAPEVPALVTLSGAELIVSASAIRRRVGNWPSARLLELPGARHEALFETEETRLTALRAALSLFDEAGGRAAQIKAG